jgi:glucokinase
MKYRLGIDLGGTAIKTGIVDENYKVVYKHSVPTDAAAKSFEEVVREMASAAEAVAKMAGLTLRDFPCVGVGSPSCINPNTGLLVFSNNTNWRNAPLKQELEKHIPVPVYVGNDANCAVIGEALAGAAKGYDNVIMLTLGTGVGGGVILNGKLYCGADGMGTELGHTLFVQDVLAIGLSTA